jgi:hypothetical protein
MVSQTHNVRGLTLGVLGTPVAWLVCAGVFAQELYEYVLRGIKIPIKTHTTLTAFIFFLSSEFMVDVSRKSAAASSLESQTRSSAHSLFILTRASFLIKKFSQIFLGVFRFFGVLPFFV